MNKISFYHSLIFFNLCIFLSAFEYLRDNRLLILSLFLILSLGISHGALDHLKGQKLIKLLKYKSIISFYILYIFIGFSIIILWLLFPKFLLLTFNTPLLTDTTEESSLICAVPPTWKVLIVN